MDLARSTYYAEPAGQSIAEALLVARMSEICAEWPRYGYRRVAAQLRHEGLTVNHKKVLRLMKENGLTVRSRRRYVATTNSDHGGPIFANLAKDVNLIGPNQLWVADITYIAIAHGFVYLAAILDAWSRRVVGYAIGRRIDARLTLTALKTAIAARRPPPGCIHHSDRGSQYAATDYRRELAEHGLKGSMGRRGNPYDGVDGPTRRHRLCHAGAVKNQQQGRNRPPWILQQSESIWPSPSSSFMALTPKARPL
jgi:putative transposase